jgi:predicted RecB family nuclease
MRADGSKLTFSPSDLSAFLACEHLTQLELAVARGQADEPEKIDDPSGDLIRKKGDEHEARYLEELRNAGRSIWMIDFRSDYDWHRAAQETEDALRSGVEIVYQACLVDGDWRGFADFVERQSDGGYEVVDTKLARHGKPSHLFQLCFYSAVVGRIQGRNPEHMHIVLGDGQRASFRVSDYDAYYRRVRGRFLEVVASRPETYPYPVEHCPLCSLRPESLGGWWSCLHRRSAYI